MDAKRFGRSGLRVSEVCLGTMTFSREADEETSFSIMDFYAEQGGSFLDTANVYSSGASEEVVGRWLKARKTRHNTVLATKVFGAMGPGPHDGGLSRRHIVSEVENSLRRLQTDYIDLYQIHRWDSTCPPEETLDALNGLVEQGKVRYIGCSNLTGWQLAQYLYLADIHSFRRFVSLQPVYNALNRGIELELLPLCVNQDIATVVYNPLAGGALTGKYTRGQALPEGSRLRAYENYYKRYYTEETFDITDKFLAHARDLGVTPAQLAVAWVVGDPRITVPIIGARNVEQIRDSIQGVSLKLTAEQRAQVPAVPSGAWVGADPVYGTR